MSSDYIYPYVDGFYTQRDFHRVYERMKGISDEKVMVVRSWHSLAHSLLSSARRAQPKEVSSASHSSSLLSSTMHSSSLMISAIHSSSLLSLARRAQLCEKRSVQLCARGQLIQESSTLPKEASLALRKRLAHLRELSSDQRG